MKTLIKNAQILDMVGETPNIRKVDVLIKDNIIEKIEKQIDLEADIKINAKNMIIQLQIEIIMVFITNPPRTWVM